MEVMPGTEYVPCCDQEGNVTEEALREAAEAASGHKIAVVVAGLPEAYESEALDREHMRLPEGHNRMIERAGKGKSQHCGYPAGRRPHGASLGEGCEGNSLYGTSRTGGRGGGI